MGSRNSTVPRTYHVIEAQPYSAIAGKLRRVSTAATLIIASAKTPRTFLFFMPSCLHAEREQGASP